MKRRAVLLTWMVIVVAAGEERIRAQEATQDRVDELERQLELQEQSIRDLRARLDELDEVPLDEAPGAVEEPVTQPGEAPSPAEEAEARMARAYGRKSPIRYTDNFDDKQAAAARPSDYVLDPEYRGFMPIGETAFMLKFNPRPRLDLTFDTQNAGSDFRFVPALIPVEGQPGHGGGLNANLNGNGSQLRVDIRAPTMEGDFRLYYQNDFFGSDSRNFQYRLQHFYGKYYGLVAGFTYGVFEDPDAWPDTVDYEGPNSVVFARRPVVHYTFALADEWNLTLGLEDPDIFLDTTADPDGALRARVPDSGFNVRWEPGARGHMQFSSIFRSIGINGDAVDDDDVFGWGLNLSAGINVTDDDHVTLWGVYGHGVGGMGNDTSFVDSDAALDSDGDLVALEYASILVALSHNWTPRWRSTATYGFANLGNTSAQNGDAFDKSHYASVNLVYQVYKRLTVGVETLYGRHEVRDGRDTDVFRFQVGLAYALFD